jgi:hypothetical protein
MGVSFILWLLYYCRKIPRYQLCGLMGPPGGAELVSWRKSFPVGNLLILRLFNDSYLYHIGCEVSNDMTILNDEFDGSRMKRLWPV